MNKIQLVTKKNLQNIFKNRSSESIKGDFGRVLIIAGSKYYPGAAVLACQAIAALRCGTDLVTIAAPEKTAAAINCLVPDIITIKIKGDYFETKHISEIIAAAKKADAILLGPGISMHAKDFVRKLLKEVQKHNIQNIVIDADGLKSITIDELNDLKCILTPHAKEFEILTRQKLPKDLNDKIKVVQKYAKKNITILLKGNIDIIACSKCVKINRTGNPGMTVGGTGDVLAGLAVGMLALNKHSKNKKDINNSFNAASAAAYLNGYIGNRLKKKYGYNFIASDFGKEIAITARRICRNMSRTIRQ